MAKIFQAKFAHLVRETMAIGRLQRFHYPLSLFPGGLKRLNQLFAGNDWGCDLNNLVTPFTQEEGIYVEISLSDGKAKFLIFPVIVTEAAATLKKKPDFRVIWEPVKPQAAPEGGAA